MIDRRTFVGCAAASTLFTSLGLAAERADRRKVRKGVWISRAEVARLPMSGPAWEQVKRTADQATLSPCLSDQDQRNNVEVLAKALVFARTGEQKYRAEVIENCLQAMETEKGGRTLALGRNLAAYVIAADLVQLAPAQNARFSSWLRDVRHLKLEGRSLVETHENRPNNWGTHAGASRVAVAVYLNDQQDLDRAAAVFKGYLGDRTAYSAFEFGDLSWQADPDSPVAINPPHSKIEGYPVGGAMPDDMRRGGSFQWPPQPTGYPWEALQGAVVQAEILHRAGYDAWEWGDRAVLRAVEFLYRLGWEARGDDQWTPWVINARYQTKFPVQFPARSGKNMGWTDWTHAASDRERDGQS